MKYSRAETAAHCTVGDCIRGRYEEWRVLTPSAATDSKLHNIREVSHASPALSLLANKASEILDEFASKLSGHAKEMKHIYKRLMETENNTCDCWMRMEEFIKEFITNKDCAFSLYVTILRCNHSIVILIVISSPRKF